MADLTFQSQQMGAQLQQHANDQMIEGVQALGQGAVKGAQAVAQGLEKRGDRKEQARQFDLARGDRNRQFEEERGDRNRQFDQNAALENRRTAGYEAEVALHRERYSLDAQKMQQEMQRAQTEQELRNIELEDRKRNHEALQAITDDQLKEQAVEGAKIDVEMRRLELEKARRTATGAPTPANFLDAFRDDPELQLQAGFSINPDGSTRPLSDGERSRLTSSIGQRQVMQVMDNLVKSVGQLDTAAAGKIAVVAMKVGRGEMTTDEAEVEINKALDGSGLSTSSDGTISKTAPANQASTPPPADKPVKVLGFDVGGIYTPDESRKIVGFALQHLDNIRLAMEKGRAPGRTLRTDNEVVQDLIDDLRNPSRPNHELFVTLLAKNGIISEDAVRRASELGKFAKSTEQFQTTGGRR